MIGKEPRIPTKTEQLNILLGRRQTLPGMWPAGRIEMVGTRLGRVAAGIFPNGVLRTVRLVVADIEKGELTTHMTFTSADGHALENPTLYTAHAFIGEKSHEPGGLEEWPIPTEERRRAMSTLWDILGKVANSGSAYDPFQNNQLASHLTAVVDSAPTIHPAVLGAASSIRR